jgi:hypothetical protein
MRAAGGLSARLGGVHGRNGEMKRKRSARKLQLSSETLLHLNQVQLVQGGTLTFEGTCENSLCPVCTSLCTGGADGREQV